MLNQPDCKVNRTTLFTLIFLFIGMAAFSQPANDECSGAIALTINNDASCTYATIGTQAYATQSMTPCISTGNPAIDVWFKFTATATKHRITITPLAYRDKIFEVYSGSCSNLTSLACINSGGLNEADVAVLSNLTIGHTYYIRVYDKYGNADNTQFSICINTATSLINNDDCTGAIAIPVTNAVNFQGPYGTLGATQSMPGCYGIAEDDIWFKFTATSSRHRIWITVANDFVNPVVEVFGGDCTNLVSKGCFYTNAVNPGSFNADVSSLTLGGTYYYRVYGKAANDVRTEVRTAVIPLPPVPANDECNGAIPLAVNNDASCIYTTAGTQEYSTQSLPPCVSTGYEALDVWFKFTATAATHKITVTPLYYRDKIFEVYSGSCVDLHSIACVNSGGLNEADMVVLNNLIIGNTYYIRVYDKYANTSQSDFTICINQANSLISNDDCTGAIPILVKGKVDFQERYTTVGATQSMAGCYGTAEGDIWFKFTATTNRHRIWLTVEDYHMNPVVEVFEGDCNHLLSKGCFYTNSIDPASFNVDLSNLTPGRTYYYRVYGKAPDNVRTEVSTSVIPLPAVPANDECSGAILLPVNNSGSCTYTTTGSQVYATQSMPSCINTGFDAIDVWFKFVATATTHKITVTPLAYRDKIFEVFSGTCNSLKSLACVNSGGLNEADMVILKNLVIGNTYYIRVYDKYGNADDTQFSICVSTESNLIPNDECTNAIAIPVTNSANFQNAFSTQGATQSMPGCYGTAEDDIWFKFTATNTRHRIWVTVANDDVDPVVEVFSGACSNLISKGCYYSNILNLGSLNADVSGLTPGGTYYYRVYGKATNDVRTDIRTAVIPLSGTPGISITASQAGAICAGSSVKYTATIDFNGDQPQYQWKVNGNNVGGNLSEFESFQLNDGDIITLDYTATVSGAPFSASSAPITQTVIHLAKPSITATGPTSVCAGESITLTTQGGSQLQWSINNEVINGANTQTYRANTTGNYYVTLSDRSCSIHSDTISITVKPLPAKPSISRIGNILTSSSPTNNQWYKNGTPIPGAISQQQAAQEPGIYAVQVTQNDCSISSDNIELTADVFNAGFWKGEVLVFPNPVHHAFYVSNTKLRSLMIRLSDISGRVVYKTNLNTSLEAISTKMLTPGIYVSTITDLSTNESVTKMMAKQ